MKVRRTGCTPEPHRSSRASRSRGSRPRAARPVSLSRRERRGGPGPGAGGAGLDGRRFRMLFEIEGVRPHEEDEWIGTQVRVGGATLQLNGDIGGCAVTTHDPDTGIPTVDTLKALAGYRREGRKEPLPLGVYGSVVVP